MIQRVRKVESSLYFTLYTNLKYTFVQSIKFVIQEKNFKFFIFTNIDSN